MFIVPVQKASTAYSSLIHPSERTSSLVLAGAGLRGVLETLQEIDLPFEDLTLEIHQLQQPPAVPPALRTFSSFSCVYR